MLKSLNCPTCGAPAPSADAVRCEYCGSTLTSIACPQCFAAMFAGMDHCPSCGAKADRATDADAPALPCPECKAEMRAVLVGATAMHECARCASQWLAADVFAALCNSREERGAITAFVDVTKTTAAAAAATVAPERVRYLPCPVCKKMMNRQNFGRRSGVILDVCKGHGAWFQAGELHRALAFIDSGGFALARQADEQRIADERAKLARTFEETGRMWTQVDIAARTREMGHDQPTLLNDALRALFS
jgi:Zn-finger nucleic acid-binding protein